jgi:hypothetical protein
MTIDYNAQMLNRYPEIVKAIKDFQAMIKVQSFEVDEMHEELVKILTNAYITTADEATINKWEKFLGITPLEQGDDDIETWLADRRETILARLYFTEKLNTKSIADVVKIFTGGETRSYFKDGVIYVLISPPRGGKKYKFENVEQELQKKTPAHLILNVRQNYRTWGQVKDTHTTWSGVSNVTDWGEVCYIVLDTTTTSLMSLR